MKTVWKVAAIAVAASFVMGCVFRDLPKYL
jgi:hypothetical protein